MFPKKYDDDVHHCLELSGQITIPYVSALLCGGGHSRLVWWNNLGHSVEILVSFDVDSVYMMTS